MKVITEPGVLLQSERYFSTPSSLARQLFLYITRCGHYYCDYHYDFLDSCDVGRLDSHKTFLLDYIRKGAMTIESDGKQFTAEAGQIALTDCKKPHRFHVSHYAERIWIHFDGACAGDFFEQIIAFHNGRPVFTPYPESRIERDMTEIFTLLKDGIHTEADISKRIYSLLCNLLIPPGDISLNTQDPINLALDYMKRHLFEDLSVRKVASVAGLSPSHFSRQFRSRTGFSPHEFIVLHRIDEAKALLHTTDLSVKEIAYRTGYHSEVNFITSFTGKVGLSPSAFRDIRSV
ncbi:MAG: helix-turn-helix domain-containing protein [Ruminococcus sp.]|jgi:AraC family transcriptional regulator